MADFEQASRLVNAPEAHPEAIASQAEEGIKEKFVATHLFQKPQVKEVPVNPAETLWDFAYLLRKNLPHLGRQHYKAYTNVTVCSLPALE
jgi:hypothetical protein